MRLERYFPIFSVAFFATYGACVYFNLALMTYEPAVHQWDWFVVQPKSGPPMYWYGWLATSLIGAVIIAALSTFVPEQTRARIWSGWTWVIALVSMAIILFVLRPYFIG